MNQMTAFCGCYCPDCIDYKTLVCPTCKATIWAEETLCPIVKCCNERNVDCCGSCPQFACTMIQEFYEETENHKQAYVRMCQAHKCKAYSANKE